MLLLQKTSSPLATPAFAHSLRWALLSLVAFPWTTTLLLISATTAVKGRLCPFTLSSPTLWEYLEKDIKKAQKYLQLTESWNDVYRKLKYEPSHPNSELVSVIFSQLTVAYLMHLCIWTIYIFPLLMLFSSFLSCSQILLRLCTFTPKYFSIWISFVFPKHTVATNISIFFFKPHIFLSRNSTIGFHEYQS